MKKQPIDNEAMQENLDQMKAQFDYLQGADGNQTILADLAKLQASFNEYVTRYFLRWNGSDYLRDSQKGSK